MMLPYRGWSDTIADGGMSTNRSSIPCCVISRTYESAKTTSDMRIGQAMENIRSGLKCRMCRKYLHLVRTSPGSSGRTVSCKSSLTRRCWELEEEPVSGRPRSRPIPLREESLEDRHRPPRFWFLTFALLDIRVALFL